MSEENREVHYTKLVPQKTKPFSVTRDYYNGQKWAKASKEKMTDMEAGDEKVEM